ncbi:MAG TPA: 30S ribosomal protein S12 methylthiotransferase RimO [Caldisericia bacterium]|nr:30S ribosomal protein S12 methylthiotransferase RimO [Caldisericia bacterium]HPF48929.1 30S ribosomal protein S12 methylthiotransferase RimO [Caldisericia bacterium]HPI83207.1 30S ribosomal protein S12 methylthiotransferase RimO [Caldisericia bacterium]HPQ92434.1 30S ribosomal protein S12 methylthiotransferase RimO [Caldisericia bacterium]HRV74468.1 30S ribosomal protein S12 methylthiotransferase RimO [Caldisericia bacterium]
MKRERVSIQALGCPKALVDAEQMMAAVAQAGFDVTLDIDDCDVLIVNTCSFIADARTESSLAIEEALKEKKKGNIKRIYVTGCWPQMSLDELQSRYPSVDGFLGVGQNSKVPELIGSLSNLPYPTNEGSLLPRLGLMLPHVSYLRVAEGCSHTCSYCQIPSIRGAYKSFPLANNIAEAKTLAEDGTRELIIIAQDSSIVGLDANPKYDLADLTASLSEIHELEWIRILYSNPMHLSERTLQAYKNKKVLPYFDIPLQHINNRILTNMNRPKPDSEEIYDMLKFIRKEFPNAILRTSLIVGFPGESDSEFEELFDLIHEIEFDRLGVFTYSDEKGTKAYSLKGKIDKEKVEERRDRLMCLQSEISLSRNEKLIGTTQEAIVDFVYEDYAVGRTKADAPEIDCGITVLSADCEPGDIVKVNITCCDEYDLEGELA